MPTLIEDHKIFEFFEVAVSTFDAAKLVVLAENRSGAARTELAETIATQFLGDVDGLTDREQSLVFDILHSIILSVETSVRQGVATRLADISNAPIDLITALANDDFEIAEPILLHSVTLGDKDLLEVLFNRTLEHQLAIANRDQLSETLSDAIVSTGNEGVIANLLANQNAEISSGTMEYLVEQSARVNTFQEPILRRQDLDINLAERMFAWVTPVLRQYVLNNFEIPEETIDQMLIDVAANEIEAVRARTTEPSKTLDLVQRMERAGVVSEDLMIEALREGQVALFVAMMAQRAAARESIVRDAMFDASGEGLSILCRASDIGKASFASIYAISLKARPGSEASFRKLTTKALAFFDRVMPDAATDVLKLWRTDTSYKTGVGQLRFER